MAFSNARDDLSENMRKALDEIDEWWAASHGRGAPSGYCTWCGEEEAGLHLDHIIPLSWDGRNNTANLQWLCQDCHRAKTSWERRQPFSLGRNPDLAEIVHRALWEDDPQHYGGWVKICTEQTWRARRQRRRMKRGLQPLPD